jgi:hypothetical protein
MRVSQLIYHLLEYLVPREALESLWTSYNLLGEGWGLDTNDFKSILRGATHLDKNIG